MDGLFIFFFVKQKTAYELRISDWSSDVCSSDLRRGLGVEDAVADMPHLTEAMLVTLGKAGIKTLDDLADLATDELVAKKRTESRRRGKESVEDKGGILG